MSSQKEQFKNNQVLLWGLKQANEDLLKEYDKGNKNPNSVSKKKSKKSKNESESESDEEMEESKVSKAKKSAKSKKTDVMPKVEKKVVRKFNLDDEYTYKDLDFLNSEYDRIEELFGNVSPEEEDELMDLQDKLYNLIEGLTAMKELTEKMEGQGVYEEETDIESDLDDEPDYNDKRLIGGAIERQLKKKEQSEIDGYEKQIEELEEAYKKVKNDAKFTKRNKITNDISDLRVKIRKIKTLPKVEFEIERLKEALKNKEITKSEFEDMKDGTERSYGISQLDIFRENKVKQSDYEKNKDKILKIKGELQMYVLSNPRFDQEAYNNINNLLGIGKYDEAEKAFNKFIGKPEPKETKMVHTTKAKETKMVHTTKARIAKGSEEAKAIGQRLAEARRKKKEALEQTEEYKKKKEAEEAEKKAKEEEAYKKLKPWFYIGDIPKGYREATQEEAIQFRKVSEYGKYKVDSTMYEIFENYNILLSYNLTKFQVNLYLNLARKKAIKALEDIEINRDRDDPRYTEAQKEKYNSKLELAKHDYKLMNKAYNWLLKQYVPNYKKVNIQLPPKPEIKLTRNEVEFVPQPKVVIDERTGKPVVYKNGIEVIEPEEPELLYFYRGSDELKLKPKFFDDNKHLKSKYAEKLYKKHILLPSKYYNEEDAKKYFFNPKETLGGAIIPSYIKRFIPVDVDYKSTKFTRKVQAIIDNVGNEQIKSIVIERTPVPETIKTAINVISQGEFNKQLKDKNYDQLFHLRLIIHTDKNKFSIEKNENINMDMNPSMTSNGESKTIFINKHITLNEMIKNAVDRVGEKWFYTYDGVSNNCQDFCLVLLKSSNIGSSDDYIFIKQNTADLFVNMRATGKLMKNITDTYGKLRGFLGGDIYH